MNIQLDENLIDEFEFIIEMLSKSESGLQFKSVETLVQYVLYSIADGSRRPGCWERTLLEMLGLVADVEDHQYYRRGYGVES